MNFEKAKNTFRGVQEADIFAKRKLDRTFEWCCAGNHQNDDDQNHHHDRYENMNPPSVVTVNSRVAGLKITPCSSPDDGNGRLFTTPIRRNQ